MMIVARSRAAAAAAGGRKPRCREQNATLSTFTILAGRGKKLLMKQPINFIIHMNKPSLCLGLKMCYGHFDIFSSDRSSYSDGGLL